MARILLVDDDHFQQDTAKQWLAVEGHSVECALTGGEGWEKMISGEFDLVILDWDLPDIQGIDILKRFRAEGMTTPVLLLTGRLAVDNKIEGLDYGADDYLTKPYHGKELAARIRLALRKQELQPAVAKPLGVGNEDVLKRADLAGTTLAARYEVMSILGEGGVGLVLKARHSHLDKYMAIKMIQRTELKEETAGRFEQEARLVSRLCHPNIAAVHDFGITERGQPYMVMEFVEGTGLLQLLEAHGGLQVEQALAIAMQICDGMSHAHGLGIVHRDLKPANVMLKESKSGACEVKILDFGCAKVRSFNEQKRSQVVSRVGEILGSPPYMSPEQIQGNPVDGRTDIYSLGCLLYETLTGCVPHIGKDSIETMVKHLQEDHIPLTKSRPDLNFPNDLERVIAKALEKEPEQRYQSMSDFKSDLDAVMLHARGNERSEKME